MANIDIVDVMDGFLKTSIAKQKLTGGNKQQNWKACVALFKLGWKPSSCDKKGDIVIVVWKKEGKKDICISLTTADQRLWIEHLKKGK